jgi:hypothetical protein
MAELTKDLFHHAMRAAAPITFCCFGMFLLSTWAHAADAEGCADLKSLPRLEGCVIQECSAKQHDSFETAETSGNGASSIDANVNALTYTCPASMGLDRIKRDLDAQIRKAGYQSVAPVQNDTMVPRAPPAKARAGFVGLRVRRTAALLIR